MKPQTLDRIGIVASTACAIHCALVPVAAVIWGIGIGAVTSSHVWHSAFVFATVGLGVLSIIMGFRRHGDYRAMMLVAPALVLCILAEAGHEYLEQYPFAHGALFAVMGTLMVIGHILNIKLTHGHMHDSTCDHDH